MADSTEARTAVLERIQKALGRVPSAESAQADWALLPRAYKRAASHSQEEILSLLTERLIDYDAQVVATGYGTVASTIQQMLTARAVQRLVIPSGLSPELLPAGFDFVVDEGFSSMQLERFEGVITTATVAIAETGTIVLQNAPGQGRRAPTLVPDYHLCIVYAADVVETVPEAMARLQPTATLATTFISGPSATADIEMTRIKGVHGPRFLDIVLIT